MQKYKFAVVALSIMGGVLTACGTLGKPVEDLRIVEGQIDNIMISEIAEKKEFLSVTHVGFSNGQGVSLAGVHPGLSKGKTVKLKLRFYKVMRGTPYYEVIEISTGPEPQQPTEPETSPEQEGGGDEGTSEFGEPS